MPSGLYASQRDVQHKLKFNCIGILIFIMVALLFLFTTEFYCFWTQYNRFNRLTANWIQRLQNRKLSCWAGYMQVPTQFRGADRAVINHGFFLSLSALRSTRPSVQRIPGPLSPRDKTGGAWSCQHTIFYSRDLKKKRSYDWCNFGQTDLMV